jgi:Spy/CpxP family protein refolding chaperone
MKSAKMSVMVALILALSLSLAAAAWARPWGWGPGHGRGMMMNLTPEQAGKLFDLKQKFMNDTAGLRKQMCVKRAELAALWKAEKPDEKAIVAKDKEINALRGKMVEKRVAMRLETGNIAPQLAQCRGGFGFGRGFGGQRGMGPGCPYYGGPGPGPGSQAPPTK